MITLFKKVIEAAQAAESRAQGHIEHRQVCVGKQIFGKEQPAGLQVLNRRHVVFLHENTPQMPIGTAKARRDFPDAPAACAVFLQHPCRAINQVRVGVGF